MEVLCHFISGCLRAQGPYLGRWFSPRSIFHVSHSCLHFSICWDLTGERPEGLFTDDWGHASTQQSITHAHTQPEGCMCAPLQPKGSTPKCQPLEGAPHVPANLIPTPKCFTPTNTRTPTTKALLTANDQHASHTRVCTHTRACTCTPIIKRASHIHPTTSYTHTLTR